MGTSTVRCIMIWAAIISPFSHPAYTKAIPPSRTSYFDSPDKPLNRAHRRWLEKLQQTFN